MKKLVEIDPISSVTLEFDSRKIQRSARALRDYLLRLDATKDRHHLRLLILPIVERALSGSLTLPFSVRDKPLVREAAGGLLPLEYQRLAAPFFVAVTGMSGLGNELLTPIVKDGKHFVWMEFEEPYDHYAEAKGLAELLAREGHSSDGKALVSAIDEGFSGTEIFIKLRHAIEPLVNAPGLSDETAERVRVLHEKLNEALR